MMRAGEQKAKSKTVEAENQFTDALDVRQGELVSISVSANGGGCTWTLQRSFNGGSTWLDVASGASNVEDAYQGDEACLLRLGVKTGAYTSGNPVCRLGKGG